METYLGDGLYASFDGYQIRLYCDRGGETHEVYLEPNVLQSFMTFVEKACNVRIKVERREE